MSKILDNSAIEFLLKFMTILLFGFLLLQDAQARTDVVVQEGEHELHFDVDKNRSILIQGLPFVGEYIYSAQQGVLYIKHPAEEQTYFLALANLYKEIPEAKVAKIGPAVKQFGVETIEWRIRHALNPCATVHASRPAGEDTHLNAADMINMNALLAYLYVTDPTPCTLYRLSSASGRVVGLPLWSTSKTGESKVTGIIHNELDPHMLPKDAVPLTEDARIRILSSGLDAEHKAIFEQTATHLPTDAQYKVIQRLFAEQRSIPNMGKSKRWTPPMLPE
jgi:hypothetical protein